MLFCITLLPGIMPGTVVYGQKKADSLITVNFKNEPLHIVLDQLSELASLNLSYNASSPAFGQSISYQSQSKTAKQVLEEVLSFIQHEYRHLGNHYLIVQSKPASDESNLKKIDIQEDTLIVQLPLNASLETHPLIRDTVIIEKEVPVYHYDTLKFYDTIFSVRTDTIFFQKSPLSSNRSISGISSNVFRFEADRNQSWAIGISYAQMAAGYSYTNTLSIDEQAIKEAEPFSLRNFKLGLMAQYNRNRLNFSAGVNLSGFSNHFSWNETNRSGGYYLTDTLDVFYNIIQGDTSWLVVEDSTYLPLDESIKLWDRFNRIGLIELQLSAAYNVYRDDYYFIYLKGGIIAALPIWISSSSVQNADGHPAREVSKNDFAAVLYGYHAGLGLRYAFSNWMDLYAESFYTRYLTPTYNEHPLKRNLHGFGLQLGLLYYF